MKKQHLIIDVAKCENCNNCLLACKDEHTDNEWPGYSIAQPPHGQRWINIKSRERGQYPVIDVAYLPMPCMHCDNAPCINAASAGTMIKRKDGIVLIDPEKAKGQKNLMKACPYHAIWWNDKEGVPQKCTFCSHLLDNGWKAPRCVQACPTGALQSAYLDNHKMAELIKDEELAVLNPELNCQPRVFYKNLYRYTHCFIGGCISYNRDGIEECAEGAFVKLFRDSSIVQEITTDHFGDFKFDNLQEKSGLYTLEIHFKNFDQRVIDVELIKSVYVGNIHLEI